MTLHPLGLEGDLSSESAISFSGRVVLLIAS